MNSFDPYLLMGLERDATLDQVRARYRVLAKSMHPDTGGNPEAWERLQLAYDVLRDEGRRSHYDATGEILRAGADNTEAEAATVLPKVLDEVLAELLQHRLRPTELDLVACVKAKLENDRDELLKVQVAMKATRKIYASIAGRFTASEGPNLFENLIARRLEAIDSQASQAKRRAEMLERVIAYLARYGFRFDQQVQVQQYEIVTFQYRT